jgi:hypothetical protein
VRGVCGGARGAGCERSVADLIGGVAGVLQMIDLSVYHPI